MSELFRLVYCSESVVESGSSFEEQIDSILTASRHNNRQNDLTGALLYNDGFFAQILEGSRTQIEKTFEVIQADRRHRNVVVLDLKPISSRRFNQWSMNFLDAERDERMAQDHSIVVPAPENAFTGDELYEDIVRLSQEHQPMTTGL